MLRLTKTKIVALLLIASTLVMFNGVSVFADTITVDFYGLKTVYMSSNAYQYTADASTYGAEPNSGVTCKITNSHYTAKNKVTGTLYTEDKGPYSQANSVTVSFSAPANHVTASITTVHEATYIGYVRGGNTTASYN
jgi:hypothetical protein